MELLSKFKISTKIIALVLMLGVLTLGIAFYGSRTLTGVNSSYSGLVAEKLPTTTLLARANRRATEMVYAGYRALSYDGASEQAQGADEAEAASYKAGVEYLDKATQLQPELKGELQGVRQRFDQIHAVAVPAIRFGQANRNEEAKRLLEQADPMVQSFGKDTAKMIDGLVAQSDKLSTELSATAGNTAWMMLIISVVVIGGAIGVSFVVSIYGVTRPLAALQDMMQTLADGNNKLDVPGTDRGDELGAMAKTVLVFRDTARAEEAAAAAKAAADAEQKMVVETLAESLGELAQGDLTAEINRDFPGAYAMLKSNYNEAVGSLRSLIGSVMESTSTIRTGSGEIAQASEDLARRTEANAASLEETAAAVAQMDGRLKTTAAAAGRTVTRADGAIATVSGGREITDEAVRAMTRVSDSAKGIDSVIEGLDKIAFQTRVLAMNAAVEAGRAGEAGRGFAVVADLVSALAMRAEEEAGRARDQLTATQTDIVAAVDMVQKVDSALSAIAGDVGEVHGLLRTMAEDNEAQATAITQISGAVTTMDQSTQQNAAMVEETSAAARNLSAEITSLAEQAGKFRVGGTTAPAATRAAAPAARPAKAKAKAGNGYVSPVQALPVTAMAGGSGGGEDWTAF